MPASEICFLTELEGIPGPSGKPIHSVNGRRISRIAKEIKASGPKGSRPLEAEFHASLVTSQRGIVAHIGPAYAPLIDVLDERVGTHFVPVNPAV